MFNSLRALQETHRALLQRFREAGSVTPELLTEIEQLLHDGRETGRVLDVAADQTTAQGLLDYWSTVLFRENKDAPEALLADFDPTTEPYLADDQCPYVGLRSFQQTEDRIFLGRDGLVRDLLQLLRAANFVAVMGAPASGRTSLLHAGLLPALARGQLPGSETWAVYEAAPPLKSQVEAATSDLTSITVIDDCDDVLGGDSEHDQRDFAERILKLADSPGKRRIIVLVLRADHEGRFARFPALEARIKQGRLRISSPTAKEIREAIERPAELVGLKLDDGIVDAIVDQLVGEKAAFALLQFTMLRLWRKRAHNRITWAAIQEVGVGRAAVVRAVQTFHDSLSAEQRQLLRQLLVRLCAGPQPASVPWQTLLEATDAPTEAAGLLEAMERESLIGVAVRATGEKAVKLAHVSLAEWDPLAGWLSEEREQLAQRRRLESKAAEWVRLGRPKNAALLREAELLEALEWLDSPAGLRMGASKDVRDLLAASQRRRRRSQQYQTALAAAFALIAGFATLEWYRADQREADEHLQVQLTKLSVIQLELIKARDHQKSNRTQADQLLNSASRASTDSRKADLENRAKRLEDPAGKIAQLVGSRERTISEIIEINIDRWKRLDDSDRRLITSGVLKLVSDDDQTFSPGSKLKMALYAIAAIAPNDEDLNRALRKRISAYRLQAFYAAPDVSQIWGVAFNPRRVPLQAAIGDNAGIVRLWEPDQPTKEPIQLSFKAASGIVNGVAFSPDGSLLAAAYRNSGVVVWTLPHRSRSRPACVFGESGTYSVAFSPDGKTLAAAASDKAAHLWDLQWDPSGQKLQCNLRNQLFQHQDEVFGVAFSPDGRLLATASGDQTVKLWNIDEPAQPLHTFEAKGPVFAVAFSPTGKQLVAAAGADGEARIWDIATKKQMVELPKEKGAVGQIAFSADGSSLVATAGADGEAIVSDVRTGETQERFGSSSKESLFGVAFSPDSKYVLTGNLDGVARLWIRRDSDVSDSTREALIKRGKARFKNEEISLTLEECEALRKLRIPVFDFADKPWGAKEGGPVCALPFLEPPKD
jgi:WD40 repeat protein